MLSIHTKRDCVAADQDPISEIDRKRVINKAKRCLEWAQDSDRPPVPGAANMTDDQVTVRVRFTVRVKVRVRVTIRIRVTVRVSVRA